VEGQETFSIVLHMFKSFSKIILVLSRFYQLLSVLFSYHNVRVRTMSKHTVLEIESGSILPLASLYLRMEKFCSGDGGVYTCSIYPCVQVLELCCAFFTM